MIIVKVEINRYEEGYTYTLLRVLETQEEVDKMQLEYPFPLVTLPCPLEFFPRELLKDCKVEGTDGWYYARPKVWNVLKLRENL